MRFPKVLITDIDGFKMLKYMSREYRRCGPVGPGDVRPIYQRKLDIRANGSAGTANHVLRDIKCVDMIEVPGQCPRHSTCATADFHATAAIYAVMPPLLKEVTPVGFPKSVEFVFGPWIWPAFLFVRPGSNTPKRIVLSPLLPFDVGSGIAQGGIITPGLLSRKALRSAHLFLP